MKSFLKIYSYTFCLLFVNDYTLAQSFLSPSGGVLRQQVFIGTGLEPEWVCTIGYTHLVGEGDKDIDLHLGGNIKFAPIIVTNGAWRGNFITAVDWKMRERLRTVLISSIYLAHDRNRAGIMNGLGFDFRVLPAYYGKKWVKGLDLGWQYTLLTHIRHSAEAKETFSERYPAHINGLAGPKDGWYGATANRFRIGFAGRRALGSHLSFQFSAGSLLAVQKQGIVMSFSHAQVPIYLESGLTFGW